MSAAQGPYCQGGCGKRVSACHVTRCPWCGRVLCMKCECPGKCATFAAGTAPPALAKKPESPR
jgi:hypothetical protein